MSVRLPHEIPVGRAENSRTFYGEIKICSGFFCKAKIPAVLRSADGNHIRRRTDIEKKWVSRLPHEIPVGRAENSRTFYGDIKNWVGTKYGLKSR